MDLWPSSKLIWFFTFIDIGQTVIMNLLHWIVRQSTIELVFADKEIFIFLSVFTHFPTVAGIHTHECGNAFVWRSQACEHVGFGPLLPTGAFALDVHRNSTKN